MLKKIMSDQSRTTPVKSRLISENRKEILYFYRSSVMIMPEKISQKENKKTLPVL